MNKPNVIECFNCYVWVRSGRWLFLYVSVKCPCVKISLTINDSLFCIGKVPLAAFCSFVWWPLFLYASQYKIIAKYRIKLLFFNLSENLNLANSLIDRHGTVDRNLFSKERPMSSSWRLKADDNDEAAYIYIYIYMHALCS